MSSSSSILAGYTEEDIYGNAHALPSSSAFSRAKLAIVRGDADAAKLEMADRGFPIEKAPELLALAVEHKKGDIAAWLIDGQKVNPSEALHHVTHASAIAQLVEQYKADINYVRSGDTPLATLIKKSISPNNKLCPGEVTSQEIALFMAFLRHKASQLNAEGLTVLGLCLRSQKYALIRPLLADLPDITQDVVDNALRCINDPEALLVAKNVLAQEIRHRFKPSKIEIIYPLLGYKDEKKEEKKNDILAVAAAAAVMPAAAAKCGDDKKEEKQRAARAEAKYPPVLRPRSNLQDFTVEDRKTGEYKALLSKLQGEANDLKSKMEKSIRDELKYISYENKLFELCIKHDYYNWGLAIPRDFVPLTKSKQCREWIENRLHNVIASLIEEDNVAALKNVVNTYKINLKLGIYATIAHFHRYPHLYTCLAYAASRNALNVARYLLEEVKVDISESCIRQNQHPILSYAGILTNPPKWAHKAATAFNIATSSEMLELLRVHHGHIALEDEAYQKFLLVTALDEGRHKTFLFFVMATGTLPNKLSSPSIVSVAFMNNAVFFRRKAVEKSLKDAGILAPDLAILTSEYAIEEMEYQNAALSFQR